MQKRNRKYTIGCGSPFVILYLMLVVFKILGMGYVGGISWWVIGLPIWLPVVLTGGAMLGGILISLTTFNDIYRIKNKRK